MGVADHVLESISGHLSRRMLEHYSHIRIDAKRQALDALDAARRSTAHNGDGNGDGADQTEIQAVVEVSDDLTSQSRHSLLLQGSPPSAKLLIPLARRDVRVVEGARLESVCRGNSTEGSNPSLSASFSFHRGSAFLVPGSAVPVLSARFCFLVQRANEQRTRTSNRHPRTSESTTQNRGCS